MNATKTIVFLLTASLSMTEVHAQCQVQKVAASDGQINDNFGLSVAIDGDWAAISAPYKDDGQGNSGAVYVFQRVGGAWIETQKLSGSDVTLGSAFGESIALVGDTLVVGSKGDWAQGVGGSGSAYVFERISGTWTQTARLIASNPGPGPFNWFGTAVAMGTDRILVGAPGIASAYVFDRVGGTWVQAGLLITNAAGGGLSVALDGDQAIVGAPSWEVSPGFREGAAFVFKKLSWGWVLAQRLTASDPQGEGHFGQAVAIRDTRALVGTGSHSHPAAAMGAVYAFVKNGSVWTQTQELLTTDFEQGDGFGSRIALSADHLIAGAYGDEDNGSTAGSAYDFRWNGSSWIQAGKLLARDGSGGDLLGFGVAIDDQTVLLGSWGDDVGCPTNFPGCANGSAYFFELAPTATQYGSCPTAAPCNNKDTHGGCRNSTGQGAVMAACGSGSVAADDLRLEVTYCPPNKLTLLFAGPAQSAVPVFDGIRVVGPQQPTGVYRYGGAAADSIGRVMRGPGLVLRSQSLPPLGRIQSGQTWNFQFWYRDNQGPCGGGTNFSNGVSVQFGP